MIFVNCIGCTELAKKSDWENILYDIIRQISLENVFTNTERIGTKSEMGR